MGTGRGTTVRELLDAFNHVAQSPVEALDADRRPGDVAGAYTRIDRAERLLGWQPQYDITEGIRHSLQWAAIRDEILSRDPPNQTTESGSTGSYRLQPVLEQVPQQFAAQHHGLKDYRAAMMP